MELPSATELLSYLGPTAKAATVPSPIQALCSAIFFFTLLHASPSIMMRLLRRDWGNFSTSKRGEIANRVTAIVNCFIIIAFTAIYWLEKKDGYWTPDEAELTDLQFSAHSVMIGYIIYDFVICVFVESEISYLFLLHHIIGALSHYVVLCYRDGFGANYSMLVYLAEMSTPFFHCLWILNELREQPDKKRGEAWKTGFYAFIFNLFSGLMMLLFFLTRVCLAPMIAYHSLTDGLEWYATNISREVGLLHAIIIVIFAIMNIYWFTTLVQKALSVFGGGAKEKVN
eukprot:TRINITY_DN1923_c0_g1_i1.p1 TRINITY_DN1923_c0_g1~~TRINITY_DN1923_c0_g1_i1.p1  ORF type:complete len:304 (+),score=41.13 TRINITY_DN1923_c0_g1_i1:59-913(+)